MSGVIAIAISVLPVVLFLGALVLIDSYKLVSARAVLLAVGAGMLAAIASYVVNVLLRGTGIDAPAYSRYVGPLVEETFKAAYIAFLMARNRVGFVVDAAIFGFAVGTGFALLENIYYLRDSNATVWTWVARGFGTAVMHGGATALVAMVARVLHNRARVFSLRLLVPGLVLSVVLHSLYNHFVVQPLLATALIMLAFPSLAIALFNQSERDTRAWLGSAFDTDQELLRAMRSGGVSHTPTGQYVSGLRSRFAPEVIVDMLCLLRLRAELGIRAKGMLMLREAGFDAESQDDLAVRRTFDEVRYLEKSIGRTGMLALHPFIHTSTRDLWQLNLLDEAAGEVEVEA